ncbi:MAG: esterase-like activity of phytase family protein [Burkholderiaceae bacterium]
MKSSPVLATLACVAATMLVACSGADDPPSATDVSVGSVRLIGQQVLPRRSDYAGTVVGGLSGIDYDEKTRTFVLVSDDRTTTDSPNAPRMYTARLTYDLNAFSAVTFESTFTMKQPDGAVYPKVPDPKVADPESVRYDRVSGNLVWTSEGDRTLAAGTTAERIIDPFVREIRPDGTHVREYTLPSTFRMSNGNTGPRGNLAFEGLTFTPSNTRAVVIAEGPRFDDGDTPTTAAGAVSRITVFDRASGTPISQFAYAIERVQAAAVPTGSFTVNGPTEILALSETRFLVLERSFSVGVVGNQVRLYEIDISAATNVLNTASLRTASYVPVTKRLVLNFETLKPTVTGIANLEAMTFGPRLPNGRLSLVVVADDNFPTADSVTDFNQFLVFEVVP